MMENRYHSLQSNFDHHRVISQNAMAEFVTLVDQVKGEMQMEITAVKENNPDILELRELISRQNNDLA